MLATLLPTYKQEQQRIRQLDPHSIGPLEPHRVVSITDQAKWQLDNQPSLWDSTMGPRLGGCEATVTLQNPLH